jgi:hypothetical protein
MYVTTRTDVGQAPMLGQHSLKQLPDWMRLYLKKVDANYPSYTWLFFIFSAHPRPYSVSTLRSLADKIAFEPRGTPPFWWGELRSALNQIRVRRTVQDKDFHPLKPWQLVKEVDKKLEDFKPEDLKPLLIEVLLVNGRVGKGRPGSDPKNWNSPFLYSRSPSWNLGKRFVKDKLPPELSKRVTDSPWYVQEVINARMANSLWVMANSYYYHNAAFRKTVDMEEKARAARP